LRKRVVFRQGDTVPNGLSAPPALGPFLGYLKAPPSVLLQLQRSRAAQPLTLKEVAAQEMFAKYEELHRKTAALCRFTEQIAEANCDLKYRHVCSGF
jgi:hypothetical protein